MEVSSFDQVQHENIDPPPGTHFNEVVIAHIFTEKRRNSYVWIQAVKAILLIMYMNKTWILLYKMQKIYTIHDKSSFALRHALWYTFAL